MTRDCDACFTPYDVPDDLEDTTGVCNTCAQEMLECIDSMEVGGVRVDVSSTERAWVIRFEDIGPALIDHRHGPWKLGEAFRRAKKYDEDEDMKHLAMVSGGDGT